MNLVSIVIVVNELLRGGAQRIIADIARGLDKTRFKLTVVYLKSHENFGTPETLETEIREAGVHVVSMTGEKRFTIGEMRRLIAFIRKEKPDIIHTFLPYAGILGRVAARLSGVKHVLSTQCNTRVAYSFLSYWVDRLTLLLADAWTAASTGIELTYGNSTAPYSSEAWRDGRRHFTVTAGVDLDIFDERVRRADRASVRRTLELPDEVPLILTISRLVEWKGPADVISALSRIPDAHLAIVGWGEMEKALWRQADELGVTTRVHFLGTRTDVPELLAASDVYVQAHRKSLDGSVWMGPNMSQMEACAGSVPSVSTRVPRIEELIEDGKTGLLAALNDPEDLARAITALLQNRQKASELARSARTRVEEHFSARSMVRTYESLYNELVRHI